MSTPPQSGSPQVTTGAATAISPTEATLQGTVNPNNSATQYQFLLYRGGPFPQPQPVGQLSSSSTPQPVTCLVTLLAPATTYHFRLVASNEVGNGSGDEEGFTTGSLTYPSRENGPVPVVTLDATDVTKDSAVLNGTVNSAGEALDYHFIYGTDTTYGSTVPPTLDKFPTVMAVTTPQKVNLAVTGLMPGTTYHFRLVTSKPGEAVDPAKLPPPPHTSPLPFGNDGTFVTPASPPVLGAVDARQVTDRSAVLWGSVNAAGEYTMYYFEYGPTENYGKRVPAADPANVPVGPTIPVAQVIMDLMPETTYHYHLVAYNPLGSMKGPDATFATGSAEVWQKAEADYKAEVERTLAFIRSHSPGSGS
jgi:hypothetical protein